MPDDDLTYDAACRLFSKHLDLFARCVERGTG